MGAAPQLAGLSGTLGQAAACCSHPIAGGATFGWTVLLVTGLVTSFGHCVGMCGPLVALAAGRSERARTPAIGWIVYHVGRLAAYASIGLALSAFRVALDATRLARPAQAAIALVAGAFTVYVGLSLLGLLPQTWSLERGPLARIGTRACHTQWGRVVRGGPRSTLPMEGRMLGLGVLNGYLPCGPVLAAAFIAAAAPSAAATTLGMGIFGLGTLPGLVLVAYGARRLSGLWRPHLYRVGGALVLVAGAQLGLRGLAATGVIDHLALGRVGIY